MFCRPSEEEDDPDTSYPDSDVLVASREKELAIEEKVFWMLSWNSSEECERDSVKLVKAVFTADRWPSDLVALISL